MTSSRFVDIGRLGLVALGSALLLAAGCASHKETVRPEVVWPLPPEKPRVRFVETIRSSQDVQPSAASGLMALLTGDDSATGLTKPYAVHVDKDGRVYVADTGWRKVLVFDYPNKTFRFLGVDGLGVLAQPVGVTTDENDRVYVSDAAQTRVVVYDAEGNYVTAFGGREHLVKPVGVAVDDQRGRLYVVDTKAHQVVVFALADGAEIARFGQHGPEDGAFNWPTNVEVGPDGNVYVVDMLNFRVEIFNPDGEFLRKFGGIGRGFGQFSKPKGIAIDGDGRVYVADAAFNNVQIFDSQGRLLLFFGGMGAGPGQFWMPAGVAVGPDGKVYVADQFNRRVNVYEVIKYPEDERVLAGGG
jgi:DNA-binding beta-propeller fold protein YncE